MKFRLRPVAVEAAIVMLLGIVLAGASAGLLVLSFDGRVRFGISDLLTAGAAGLAVAVIVRIAALLHRSWTKTVGRFTAAAALCAAAGIAGALVVMVPSQCPGEVLSTGRCGVEQAASWGQVAGLAAIVNFGLVGFVLGLWRGIRDLVGDGSAQGLVWFRALNDLRRRRGARAQERPRDPRGAKGRPTPSRADAREARRKRLSARA